MNAAANAPITLEPPDWKGATGDRWATNIDHFESMLTSIGDALLAHAALEAGETVVEIGCGGGGLTQLIATKVAPNGMATGLDISPVLVDLATARAGMAAIDNIRFEAGDAQVSMPAAAPFDRLISRFGVMFFADPAAAMVNLRAMLKPGGRLDFAVWAAVADNIWAGAMMQAARAHLGLAPPEPRAPGPFAFSDAEYLRALLEGAGFTSIAFTLWSGMVRIGQPGTSVNDVANVSMATGSLADALRNADDAVQAAVHAELVGLIEPYMTPEGAVMPASVHLVSATA